MTRACFLMMCTVLAGTAAFARAEWHPTIGTDPGGRVSIELSSPIEHLPPGGYMPCWVTIKNFSGAAHTWNVRCLSRLSSGGRGTSEIIASQSLRVENGTAATLPLLLPLWRARTEGYFYSTASVMVEGFAVTDGTVSFPFSPRALGPPTAFIGMGSTLALPLWGNLTKAFADITKDLRGSPVQTKLLGSDWRGLIGFDCLWITDTEYAELDAGQRLAIRQWVDFGGTLYLSAQTLDPALRAGLGLPPTGDEAHPGFGFVKLLPWDGKPMPTSEAFAAIDHLGGSDALREARRQDDSDEWPAAIRVGAISINATFLIIFIVLFAGLIGPVNLFWIANAKRRHRLFWSTPLISLGASLILILLIIIQDGFGGRGERSMVTLLVPDQRKALIMQEQVTRTGVLLDRHFAVSEDVFLLPLGATRISGKTYEQSGRNYSGDWFASRSVQSQRLEAVVPSRAEIQLLNAEAANAGAPPVVVSSIPAVLTNICYTDASGRSWRGGGLRTGERTTLRPDTGPADLDFRVSSRLARVLQTQIRTQPGFFYAHAEEGPFIETLPAIRWKRQDAVYLGAMTIAH